MPAPASRFWHELCHHRQLLHPPITNPTSSVPTELRLFRPTPHLHKSIMFQLSEESKVCHVLKQCHLLNAHAITGAHRAYHRCFPCRYPLWLLALDPLPWLLSEPAKALPHPVRHPDTTQRALSRHTVCQIHNGSICLFTALS